MGMEDAIKIVVSGLDAAGKTSILTALDKKYDFQKEILELKPTIKVEYHQMSFLGRKVYFWDMGGQEKYRKIYQKRQDIYFDNTDLLLFVIDIQDKERFESSLSYLDMILTFFNKNNMDVPLIISFHKYDPELRGNEEILNDINTLREMILERYSSFKILFQQSSIFDIISIVQLISYGLSVFDDKFFELSELLEAYLEEFKCLALILFDLNGIIISEFYNEIINADVYIELLETIKEHFFLLKRLQEEKYETNFNFYTIEDQLLSYLHRIKIKDEALYISVVIEEKLKENVFDNFADFLEDISNILSAIL
ncbi:MAG: ADP-ribosylation factor-like protein [Promethearchaeota archaeon]